MLLAKSRLENRLRVTISESRILGECSFNAGPLVGNLGAAIDPRIGAEGVTFPMVVFRGNFAPKGPNSTLSFRVTMCGLRPLRCRTRSFITTSYTSVCPRILEISTLLRSVVFRPMTRICDPLVMAASFGCSSRSPSNTNSGEMPELTELDLANVSEGVQVEVHHAVAAHREQNRAASPT